MKYLVYAVLFVLSFNLFFSCGKAKEQQSAIIKSKKIDGKYHGAYLELDSNNKIQVKGSMKNGKKV